MASHSTAKSIDQDLLRRFVAGDDEEAFGEIVRRHCELVLGVCRRVLRNQHDAEDAFQATFMVLAKSAARIRRRQSLSSWLYGTAYRISLRTSAKRGRRREQPLKDEAIGPSPFEEMSAQFQQQVLDEELNRLPDKYRGPLVLRYLMGQTAKAVAMDLGLSEAALEGRLKRGKRELRLRLVRRGVTLGTALAIARDSQLAAAAQTSCDLVAQTVHASIQFASAGGSAEATSAHSLAAQELTTMSTSWTFVSTCVIMLGLATIGLAPHSAASPLDGPGDGLNATAIQIAAQEDPSKKEATDQIIVAQGQPQPATAAANSSKQATFDMKQRTDAEMKTMRALEKQVKLDFIETSLKEAMEFIRDRYEIPLQIDEVALRDSAIGSSDVPITRSFAGISLKSALGLLLKELELDYMIQHEVLMITTKKKTLTATETHVYNLQALDKEISSEDLMEVIQQTIRPDSWRNSSVSRDMRSEKKTAASTDRVGAIGALPGRLVVTHCQRAHEEIVDLLSQLYRSSKKGQP